MVNDIRWKQRFDNYKRAYTEFADAIQIANSRELSKLEKQGLIQSFEYTHELAWNLLKDFLEEQGFVGLIGSKNVTRESFSQGLIEDGEVWMEMIKSRNLTSHTYDQKLADEIHSKIVREYAFQFQWLHDTFLERNDR